MPEWITKTPHGRWKARYRAPDGKTPAKTFDRKSDAQRWRREEMSLIDRGGYVDPKLGKTRFAEWAGTVMDARIHTRASTEARDRSYLRSLILPTFGGFELRAKAPKHVQEWVSKLNADGLAPETVRKAYTLVRSILQAAIEEDRLVRSPVRGINLPRIVRREMRFVTREELAELLEAIPDRYRLLVKNTSVFR